MAAANKPTALHVSLIISVMLTVILGVLTWMSHRDFKEAVAKAEAVQADLTASKNAHENRNEDIAFLKTLIGHQQEQVGRDDPDNPATVAGQMKSDLATLGGDLAQPTYHDTLVKLRTELNSVTQQRNELNAQLEESKKQILALQEQYQGTVDVHQQAAATAQADLQAQIKEKQELAEAKQREIDKVREDYSRAQVELDALTTKTNAQIAALNADLENLRKINNDLRDKLAEVTRESYEVADGLIRSVDHNTGLVWINLGEADKLQKRTTFSVYGRDNHGYGRDPEDIKGSIEVTNITGPHLAEARILSSDLYRPIAPGDPIYTPLWSPNQVETFCFVGLIDFDGDHQSDRERLHEIVSTAGGKIEIEVDDQGKRIPEGGKMTVNTKFLVVGDVPDPTKSAPQDRDAHKLIHSEAVALHEEARFLGVRSISLNTFLDYIGYRTTQRLFVPSSRAPYTLRSGAKNTGEDATVPYRGLGGRSSGVYGGERRTNQPIRSPETRNESPSTEPSPSAGSSP